MHTSNIMEQNRNDGYYFYNVSFVYKEKTYEASFESTIQLTSDYDKFDALMLASSSINARIRTIETREEGVFPHHIVISGKFGVLQIKC